MSIVATGIDLVEVSRIAKMLADHGDRFLDRCFTPAEQAYCKKNTRRLVEHLAGRFAAKEAILKALGTGWSGGIAWTDMEILPNDAGKPQLTLTGESAAVAARLEIKHWHISITHTATHAAATAIAERD